MQRRKWVRTLLGDALLWLRLIEAVCGRRLRAVTSTKKPFPAYWRLCPEFWWCYRKPPPPAPRRPTLLLRLLSPTSPLLCRRWCIHPPTPLLLYGSLKTITGSERFWTRAETEEQHVNINHLNFSASLIHVFFYMRLGGNVHHSYWLSPVGLQEIMPFYKSTQLQGSSE